MLLKFDDLKKLHQKKYRYETGYFLVEGEHLVLELQQAAQHNPALQDCELFITENYQGFQTPFKKNLLNAKQMAQLSDTKTPQGIIAVTPFLPAIAPTAAERVVYLHEIQDPGNLGTILRSLAWFGNFRCLLSPGSVDPYNPKVVRSSMGAIFHTPIEIDIPLTALTQRYSRIAYLDMHGAPISDAAFKECECFLFGNEARGVPRDDVTVLNAHAFTIPGSGTIESLNLATAVNLSVYELVR